MAEKLVKIFEAAPQLGTLLGLTRCIEDGGQVLQQSAIDWNSQRVEWGQTLLLAAELRANRLGSDDYRRISLSQNTLTSHLRDPASNVLGMAELCHSLTGHPGLQELDLAATGSSDATLTCLAGLLDGSAGYGRLQTLDLSGNAEISIRGATALAGVLPSSSLTQLIVGCEQRIIIPLHYDGVHGHPNLNRSTSLDLNSSGVTPTELILLAAALPTLKITQLDISHNARLELQDTTTPGALPRPQSFQPADSDPEKDNEAGGSLSCEADDGNELALVLPLAGTEDVEVCHPGPERLPPRPEHELQRELALAKHRLKLAEAQLVTGQSSLPDDDEDPSVYRAVPSFGLSTQVPAHWLTFCRALHASAALEDLKLESCGIGPASAFALSFELPFTLTHLSLRGNPLSRDDWDVRGVAALGAAIHSEDQPAFKQLDLTACDLGKKAKAAMKATRSGSRGGTHWMWRW